MSYSIDRSTSLENIVKYIYNNTFGDVVMEVTDYQEIRDADNKNIICKFGVHIDDANKDYHGTQELELILPDNDNNLVTVGEKERVQITSARRQPKLSIGKSWVRMYPINIQINNNAVSWSRWDENVSRWDSLCKYFGIYHIAFPDGDETAVPNLDQYGVNRMSEVEIDRAALDKIEVVSEGMYKFPTNKFSLDLLMTLISIMKSDDLEKYNEDTPLDFEFMTAMEGLAYEIKDKKKSIRQTMMYNWNKNTKLYTKAVQNIINHYFRMQSDNFRNVQVPKISNAVSMMSQAKRIYFYDYNKDTGSWDKMQLYNNYFTGVIDAIRTADGPLTGINNELTLDTKIDKGNLLIKVYDKKFNEIEIPYIEYTKGGVLLFDYIDYTNKKYNTIDGKYTYMKYGKYYTSESEHEFKYLKTYDNRLTASTACIPFLNRMVPTRSLLSSHFLDQSIPVTGAKPPIVSTSYCKKYYKDSPYNTKCDIKGTVTVVKDGYVKVKDESGKEHLFGDGRTYQNTTEHTTNLFTPRVKVGDKVESGDVLMAMNSFVDGEFTTQVPLYVMYGTYYGHEHEDGIILSESAAKKFAHTQVLKLSHVPKYEVTFSQPEDTERYNKFGIIKVGQKVKANDVLFSYTEYPNEDDPESRLAATIIETIRHGKKFTKKYTYKAPLDINDGIIKDVRVHINEDILEAHLVDESTREFMEYYLEEEKKRAKEFKSLTGSKLASFEFENKYDQFTIEITIEYFSVMAKNWLSGKLTNYYASKGVNTYIIPDSECPYDEFGNKIECIIQSMSVYSRQNPGQIHETKLGLIGLEGWKLISKNGIDANKEWLDLLYPTGYDVNKLMSDGNNYGYIRIPVDPFNKYYTDTIVLKILSIMGLGNGNARVFIPRLNKWTEHKCTVGVTAMMRLHFLAEKKAKATADQNLDHETDNITFMGNSKEEGQKVGQQELHAYMGQGLGDIINDYQQQYDNKSSKFQAALLMLGMKFS